ncbi:MAG: ribonuclease III [Anaerolineae bacterium]|nr:ribonuclease III [Anaerolineae bacterium]
MQGVMEVKTIQAQIGLRFRNDNLLEQALTHRSYINEHGDDSASDNERLEFLGDAVLDFLVGDMLYQRFPEMPEGDLTRLRAALVRTESLAELARNLGLGQALRMGKGEETSGGRERLTNLCATFEAVVGALYLDQTLEAVRMFVTPLLDNLLEQILLDARDKDARSRLQEWSQATHNLTPAYRTVSATGPDHQKEFVVEVVIGERGVAHGTGRSKQAAAQSAAREALRLLEKGELVV